MPTAKTISGNIVPVTRRASRTGRVSFDKRERPDSSACAPDYDFEENHTGRTCAAPRLSDRARRPNGIFAARSPTAARASAHADGGEQQANGVHGRQAEPGDPGFSMRCHGINSESGCL